MLCSSLPCFLSQFLTSPTSLSLFSPITQQQQSNHNIISSSSMAVEARNMNFFPSQLLPNRILLNPNQGNMNMYNTQMDSVRNFNGSMPDSILPFYQSVDCNPVSGKASMNKADSGVTYNITAPRKRPRDPINDIEAFNAPQKSKNSSGFASFIDQDIIFQIQQQQSEMDRFIADHTEKVRMELEERRKRQSRMLIQSIQDRVVKKLKEKDEEIERIANLNWVLQERVKSLCMENQIWRDLAQSNEATANSLRNNLEQVLAHVGEDRQPCGGNATADDAESSCGSCNEWAATVGGGGGNDDNDVVVVGKRMCRKCGEKESSVLLLPCRHLCLCTSCGSTLTGTCPVCDSVMNASVHVNMS
ncbi:BOI-related E3 ubiquitin-protein ligase 1 [Tripterygium wilfordii]|uniref:BOI-related E3 ubiquitin-protein ligase 1 n=1 Tax=Tripterygium wilfordii TaxID=458696 RepID=A0A7J7C4Y9_TRIWF|nr:BOI-related E3 ubiquitin-protein ligase 1-like [Tripterygium wilfordii]KAF5729193.1 BOI-related E3 ubiquitin-protein ligase 1 [Tripterygium wilfordii]